MKDHHDQRLPKNKDQSDQIPSERERPLKMKDHLIKDHLKKHKPP